MMWRTWMEEVLWWPSYASSCSFWTMYFLFVFVLLHLVWEEIPGVLISEELSHFLGRIFENYIFIRTFSLFCFFPCAHSYMLKELVPRSGSYNDTSTRFDSRYGDAIDRTWCNRLCLLDGHPHVTISMRRYKVTQKSTNSWNMSNRLLNTFCTIVKASRVNWLIFLVMLSMWLKQSCMILQECINLSQWFCQTQESTIHVPRALPSNPNCASSTCRYCLDLEDRRGVRAVHMIWRIGYVERRR